MVELRCSDKDTPSVNKIKIPNIVFDTSVSLRFTAFLLLTTLQEIKEDSSVLALMIDCPSQLISWVERKGGNFGHRMAMTKSISPVEETQVIRNGDERGINVDMMIVESVVSAGASRKLNFFNSSQSTICDIS